MFIITYSYEKERREHRIKNAPDAKKQLEEFIKWLKMSPSVKGIEVKEK